MLVTDNVCERRTFDNPDVGSIFTYSIVEPSYKHTVSVTIAIRYIATVQHDIADNNVMVVSVCSTSHKTCTPSAQQVTGKHTVLNGWVVLDFTDQTTAVALTVLYGSITVAACHGSLEGTADRTCVLSIVAAAYTSALNINTVDCGPLSGTEDHHVGIGNRIQVTLEGTGIRHSHSTDWWELAVCKVDRSYYFGIELCIA